MRLRPRFINGLSFALLLLTLCPAKPVGAAGDTSAIQFFVAKGTVLEIKPDRRTVVIQHEAISNYMAAMTMPFKVRTPAELAGLHRPTIYVVDAKGVIRFKNVRGEAMDKAVDQLLKEMEKDGK